jgi:fumarate reductase subunit D
MSDPTPPPPPSYTPPPPPPPTGGTVSPNRNVMLVLSYLGILALIPLLVEKEDREVQWHAKNGLVLFVAYIAAWFVIHFAGAVIHFLACAGCLAGSVLAVLYLVVVILCIVKALNGERFIVPGLSQFVDRF